MLLGVRYLYHKGRALMNDISSLIKETPDSSLSPSAMWTYKERVTFEPDAEYISTMILDLASKNIKSNFLLLKSHLVCAFCGSSLKGLRQNPIHF